jgi:hypothetical protein
MSKKLGLLILPILAVMLVSGCVGTGVTGVSGPGVVILDFQPDLTQVFSGDDVRLQLRAENQGELRAEEVVAELTGIDVDEWGFGFTSQERMGSLVGFDATTGTPGGTKTVSWNLEAPELAKGLERVYEPIVKLSYDYETSASKMITIVDQAELTRIIQQGRTLAGKPTQYSSGPLTVELTTGDYVKTSDQYSGATYDIFPLNVKITNTQWGAGGTVVESGFGGDEAYPVDVTITPPSGTSFVYSGYGSDCGTTMRVDLWQGRDFEITCELEVNNPPNFREDRPVDVNLEYRFQTEATTQITVVGTGTTGFF